MVRLTSLVKTSGCAAKLSPKDLDSVLSGIPLMRCDGLLEGFEHSDDALVYDMGNGSVLIETVDFFPPMVDDPFTFGQIAAANALSDIYAMGGEPKLAMNLMCFPHCLDLSVMKEILLGGMDKVKQAGAVIAGGHTISDREPKYGLSVTGFAKKDEVWYNRGLKEGDVIILTKKIGVGVVNTAGKVDEAGSDSMRDAIASMTTLNKRARDAARDLSVHAATDVTGFSLLGHLREMAKSSEKTVELEYHLVPQIDGALELAKFGFLPEGAYNNREFISPDVSFSKDIRREEEDILFDPQTSGGLLLSMDREDAEIFLSRMKGTPASIIADVKERGEKLIEVLP